MSCDLKETNEGACCWEKISRSIYTKPLKQNGLCKAEASRLKAKLEAIRYMISKSDGSCLTGDRMGKLQTVL